MFGRRLNGKENSLEIKRHDRVPLVFTDLKEWTDDHTPGIVYKNAQLSPRSRAADNILNILHFCQIRLQGKCLTTLTLDFLFNDFQSLCIDIDDGNSIPITGQAMRNGPADS